jgi:hypothetical protein
MGLKDGFDCGVWEDDGEDLGLAEGESRAGERSVVIAGWGSDWDGLVTQREEAWAMVDHGGDDILEVTPLRMVSSLIEEGKQKTMDPSE